MFIEYYISDKIKLKNGKVAMKQAEVISKLEKYKFPTLSSNADATNDKKSYSYLTNMSWWSLTEEEIVKLKQQAEIKEADYNDYLETPLENIWLRELNELEIAYNKWFAESTTNDEPVKKRNNKKK